MIGRRRQSVSSDAQKQGRRSELMTWRIVGLTAVAIWLGWQAILVPITERAPPEMAIRLASTSPLVLSRAAESEFAAGRIDNADFLARRRLSQSPFDVRALRVAGMAADKGGQVDQGNEIVTLAGNWSLRDDPSHGWLVQHRLRQGDYKSALAHADTLVRRREDVRPQVFDLFTAAAKADTRALNVVVGLIAVKPPWSADYFDRLYRANELQVAASLAVGLQNTNGPLPDDELRRLYYQLINKAAPSGAAILRAQLNRPASPTGMIVDGAFDDHTGVQPFAWNFPDRSGLVAEIAPAPTGGDALSVTFQGFGATGLVEQVLSLNSGTYELRGYEMTERMADPAHLTWSVTCAGVTRAQVSASAQTLVQSDRPGWRRFSLQFTVPAEGCPLQWLHLNAPDRDRTEARSSWFDDLTIIRRNRPTNPPVSSR